MRRSCLVLLLAGALPVVGFASDDSQQSPTAVKAVQIIGLPGVKENAKGSLSVENGNLHFTSSKTNTDVSASSIQDVTTGSDSKKAVGKTLGTLSMAAPYGGGRVVSLFRKKIDTLTVEYRDADGALHAVIFTMPLGSAEKIKQQLIAQGAHTAVATESAATAPKEQKQ